MVGLLHIAALTVVAAGALKVHNPVPTMGALSSLGMPAGKAVVTVVAVSEIAIGLSALIMGDAFSTAALGLLFVAFSIYIAVALTRQGESARCGCFGASDAPPSPVHIGLNLMVAATAIALVPSAPHAISDVIAAQPALGIPYLGFVLVGAVSFFLILDRMPRLAAATR